MTFTIHLTLGMILVIIGLLAIPIFCRIFEDCKSGEWGPPLPVLTLFFTLVTWAILILIYIFFH